VLASGGGTNLQAMIDACASGLLDGEIVQVVANRPCGALRRAEQAGISALYLPLHDRRNPSERDAHDVLLADLLAVVRPDLVVLAGWMLLLGPEMLRRYEGRTINVHPALLPDDGGDRVESSAGILPALRGAHTVRDALRLGLPVTGATVHVVIEELDAGPVILQEEVPILPGDDETILHERIKTVEHALLPRAAALMLATVRAGTVSASGEEGV
jgi:phosphoribosylglycinamide formyltransferase-1